MLLLFLAVDWCSRSEQFFRQWYGNDGGEDYIYSPDHEHPVEGTEFALMMDVFESPAPQYARGTEIRETVTRIAGLFFVSFLDTLLLKFLFICSSFDFGLICGGV